MNQEGPLGPSLRSNAATRDATPLLITNQ